LVWAAKKRDSDRRNFAKEQYEKGKPLVDAVLEGARLRLPSPVLMTSFAFILGLRTAMDGIRRRFQWHAKSWVRP